jgi:hypothetical protein
VRLAFEFSAIVSFWSSPLKTQIPYSGEYSGHDMAKVMRALTNPKMVRVWEETEKKAVGFIRPDPASQK